jgi:hypothetical protein
MCILKIEMENNEIKIILSERGKELTNVGTFKYRFIGIRKNGELLKYFTVQSEKVAPILCSIEGFLGFFFFFWFLLFDFQPCSIGLRKRSIVLNRVPALFSDPSIPAEPVTECFEL